MINLPLLEASLAGIALLVGLWFIWVNHTETSLFHDSLVLQQFAEHLSAGDLSDFWPHIDNYAAKAPGDLYMSIYPHQAGLLLLMTGLRCLFGSGMVKALQVMNLLAAIGVSALLCSLARAVERPRGERAVLALVAYGFLPNVLLSVFPYGNNIGLLLVLAASRVLLASLRNASGAGSAALWLAPGLISLSGLMIKSTYIYLVAGVVLIALLGCIKEKACVRAVVLLFSTGVLLALSSSVPRAGFKALVGYALPEDQPKMTWFAIGLDYQPSADPRPGWYNPIGMDNRIRHNGNVGDEEATAESVVLDRLGHLAGNPGYGAWFFAKKLAYEWLDPTYDSYFVASFSKMSEEDAARWGRGADARFYPMDLTKPHGYVCLVLFIVMDACQSLLYLGAALGARDLMREALHGGSWGGPCRVRPSLRLLRGLSPLPCLGGEEHVHAAPRHKPAPHCRARDSHICAAAAPQALRPIAGRETCQRATPPGAGQRARMSHDRNGSWRTPAERGPTAGPTVYLIWVMPA